MQMLCYKCDHSWSYKGKKTEGEDYITCPGCYYKIRLDKALMEAPSKQKLLTILPNKKGLPNELLSKLPTTRLKTEFETIRDQDGFVYLVDRKIARQFKEALEETLMPGRGIEEQGPVIRMIPRDPIKILEHQQEYGLRIAN